MPITTQGTTLIAGVVDAVPVISEENTIKGIRGRPRKKKSEEEAVCPPPSGELPGKAVGGSTIVTPAKSTVKRGRKPKEIVDEGRSNKRVKLTLSGLDPSHSSTEHYVPLDAPQADSSARGKKVKHFNSRTKTPNEVKDVKWKTIIPVLPPTTPSTTRTTIAGTPKENVRTTFKPRIWTSSREELFASLPEISGSLSVNGLSWERCGTPILILDEHSAAFGVQGVEMSPYILDLVTSRSFICPIPQQPSVPYTDFLHPKLTALENIPAELSGKVRRAPQYKIPKEAMKIGEPSKNEFAALPNTLLEAQGLNTMDKNFHNRGSSPDIPLQQVVAQKLYSSNPPPPEHPPENLSFPQPQTDCNLVLKTDIGAVIDMIPQIPPLGRDLTKYRLEEMPAGIEEAGEVFTSLTQLPHTMTSVTNHDIQQEIDQASFIAKSQGSDSKQTSLCKDSESRFTLGESLQDESPHLQLNQKEYSMRDTDIMSDTCVGTIPQSISISLSPDPSTPPQPPEFSLTNYVPLPLPADIHTIINAYISGTPLTLVVARTHLLHQWAMNLPDNYVYNVMGYFKVLGVEEKRMDPNHNSTPTGDACLNGQVQWQFRLHWASGGEEFILSNVKAEELKDPWWHSPPSDDSFILAEQDSNTINNVSEPTSPGKTNMELELDTPSISSFLQEPEDAFPTTSQYLEARRAHPNHKFRHHPLNELYESLLPTTLLAPFGQNVLDTALPRGWICSECGKINFQAAMRHRKCSNLDCPDSAPKAYAIPLDVMRDPQDRLEMIVPINTYPAKIRVKVGTFDDGMKVLSYYNTDEEQAFVKHIFTGNHRRKQQFAMYLLREIQLRVEIVRPLDDSNNPYFTHSVAAPRDLENPTDSAWPGAQDVIKVAKMQVVRRVQCYAEVPESQFSVNRLKIVSWVTTGSKKSAEVLRAKDKAIAILFLGCNVSLTLTPRGDWPLLIKHNGTIQVAASSASVQNDASVMSTSIFEKKYMEKPTKSGKPTFDLMLVHGDIVVLYGDDFEYSIKRDGTSFLVIASHEVER